MKLGAFSVSLAVADLAASREFYERLGFEVTGGNADEGWLILKNEQAIIGLFHGMFEGNILTFNPGWTQDGVPADGDFTDVRDVQAVLRSARRTDRRRRHGPGAHRRDRSRRQHDHDRPVRRPSRRLTGSAAHGAAHARRVVRHRVSRLGSAP